MAIIEFSSGGAILKVLSGGVFGVASWGIGLVVMRHPLLAHLRLASSGIAFSAMRFPFPGR